MSDKTTRVISNLLFFTGNFLGLALAIASIWAALEAQAYYFTGAVYEPFNGLRCPLFVTRSEKGMITATFDNPGDQAIQPYYQVEVSGIEGRKFENQFSIPPRESKSVQWSVDAEDVDLGAFIMVKVQVLPRKQALCGMVMLNVPGPSGEQVFTWTLLVSLLGIAAGFFWRNSLMDQDSESKAGPARQALGISVLAAMLFAFIGWTPVSLVCCVIAILLLVILLRIALI
jgi:hypothetical protein